MTREPPEPPNLDAEVAALAAARIAKLRHAKRIRIAHKAARSAGVDIRNALKLARTLRERQR